MTKKKNTVGARNKKKKEQEPVGNESFRFFLLPKTYAFCSSVEPGEMRLGSFYNKFIENSLVHIFLIVYK